MNYFRNNSYKLKSKTVRFYDSKVSDELQNLINEIGENEDDVGQIIPKCLSGSGESKNNLFPQNREVNRILVNIENSEKEEINKRKLWVEFKYTFEYSSPFHPERPSAFIHEVRWRKKSGELVRHYKRIVLNLTFSQCNDSSKYKISDFIEYVFDERLVKW